MGKFIKFLLVCLGFKSLTACEVFYGTDEYGTPYAEYEAKGRVSDSEGTPISGIKVSMGDEYGMDSVAVTDAEGRFHVIHGTFPFRQAEMVEEGDGWDEGDYAVKEDVNVVLERQ